MKVDAPSFPLEPAAFTDSLRKGHGRAMQQIEAFGAVGLEDRLIEACTSCLIYDPQCEAARAPWLYSMVARAGLSSQVLLAIDGLMRRPPPEEDHRDLEQRCSLLKELAAAGSEEARRLLYLSLTRPSGSSGVIGADQIVALAGIDGLVHVARQLGRWRRADPDMWIDDDHVTQVKGGLATLERHADTDPDVESYLGGLARVREIRRAAASNRPSSRTWSAAEIVSFVASRPKDSCHWFGQWGAKADSGDREAVFAALLATDEPEQVKRLFKCFTRTGLPHFDQRLLRWIGHPDSQIQWAAVRAFAPIVHGELRQLALQMIAKGSAGHGVALLVNNCDAGDLAWCMEHLAPLDDPHETHHLVGSLLDLCTTNPGADALDGLLYVYGLSPCSNCRGRAVATMIGSNIAPAWVLAESRLDADPDTRALCQA